ncbi:MAG: DUF1318 domain-containing protein [bacterium]|nr:DUF1318 domain-containing protein [bacterium]
METKIKTFSIIPVLLFILASCVTINIYFPAAAVEKAADQIVQETWGDKATEPAPEKQEKEGLVNRLNRVAGFIIGTSTAYAQEADINVTTPAIRALKGSIADRSGSIKPYMDTGNVGIGGNGLLVVRTTDGLSLKDKAAVTRLVDAENKDRMALYREIAEANGFGPDRIDDIQRIFAASWIKQARSGWWVQSEGGAWNQK